MKQIVKIFITYTIQAFFVLSVLPILFVLEPVIRLRFCLIPNQRIGHLAVNTDTFLRRFIHEEGPPRTFYIFLVWEPANQQMINMFRRHLAVIQNKTLVRIHYMVLPIISRTRFLMTIKGDSHPYTLVANTMAPVLTFTLEEERTGKESLREMGIGDEDWFVCCHGRDTAYLDNWRPQYKDIWAKTNYRNSNEADYLQGLKQITAQGGFALRMGAAVTGPYDTSGDPKIIDYSTHHRTDFLDIYLAARCRFFIGTNSGYDFIPTVFGVPMLMVNMTPPCRVPCGPTDLFIPKLLLKEDDGTYLPFNQALELGFFTIGLNHGLPELCQQNRLRMLDNTPEEILDGCLDMIERIAGDDVSEEARWLQQLFYENFLSNIPGFEVLGAKISPRFAIRHKDVIVSAA